MMRSWIVSAAVILCIGGDAFAEGKYFGPLEQKFAEIEKNVPGFAGWHVQRDGSVIVRVKGSGREAAAIEHVSRVLAARDRHRGVAPQSAQPARRITAMPARFSFSELTAFRDGICSRLPFGVHLVDLDEAKNVISLEVAHESVTAEVYQLAAQLGIPAAAVNVAVTAPPEAMTSQWDYQRPVLSGNGFTFTAPHPTRAGQTITQECTVGMMGYWRPYGTTQQIPGFLTNSHCTAEPFQPGTTIAYQGGAAFAIESQDPPAQTVNWSPCQWGGGSMYPCRWSDAAFYEVTDLNAFSLSTLATTLDSPWCTSNGNTVIGALGITGELSTTPVGEPLDKIGANSGWTWGWTESDQTCVHVITADGVWRICQDASNILMRAGDSGSPVFRWYSDQDVRWVGLMFASSRDTVNPCDQGYRAYHSPLWAIMSDLPYFSRY